MGGTRAELPQRARGEGAGCSAAPGCAVQGANAVDFALASEKGGPERVGEAGRLVERSLTYPPIGALCEVWLPLRRRHGSRPAFLLEGLGVAVTSRAERLGQNQELLSSLERGWWGKGAYALMGSFQLLSGA